VRYYFNVKDGITIHDQEGMDLAGMDAAKKETVRTSGDMLGGLHSESFWSGDPWALWVTDQPSGGGNTILALAFSSRLSGQVG
jgi:hypothetical protein